MPPVLADLGTVLQYRDELSEIGPVLTRLAGRGDGVVMPSVQHFALQQQLASLTATMADHEDAILELERQVASLEPGVQSLDTKVRELGVLLSESMSVVEDRIKVMDEDRINELERKVSGVCCDSEKRQLVVAELQGNFERFMVQVDSDLQNQWSGIMNEVHGDYGHWLGQYREFQNSLLWKGDFFARFMPKLDKFQSDVRAEILLQYWVDTFEVDD